MREGNTQTVTKLQHAPRAGCARPGGESRLPAAIVPPPGLGKIICMRKICKKFDARSMQVYFFAKYCLKRLISPTTNQNEHPRVQNNPNLALHGTKRDPIWAKRKPKWPQRVPKGRQKWTRNQQKYHKRSLPRKRSKKGGRPTKFWGQFWRIFGHKSVQKSMRKTMPKNTSKNLKIKQKTRHDPTPKNQDSQIYSAKADPSK